MGEGTIPHTELEGSEKEPYLTATSFCASQFSANLLLLTKGADEKEHSKESVTAHWPVGISQKWEPFAAFKRQHMTCILA